MEKFHTKARPAEVPTADLVAECVIEILRIALNNCEAVVIGLYRC